MQRKFPFLLALVFLLVCSFVSGQENDLGFLSELYGYDNFGAPDETGSEMEVLARIVPGRETDDADTVGAWLVVDLSVAENWYVYSITQDSNGGKPTVITAAENDSFELSGPFLATSSPKIVKSEYFTVPLEEYFGKVRWFAPLVFKGKTIPDDASLNGEINGQACLGSENGLCTLFDEEFTAKLDKTFDPSVLKEPKQEKTTATEIKTLPIVTLPGANTSGSGFSDFNIGGLSFPHETAEELRLKAKIVPIPAEGENATENILHAWLVIEIEIEPEKYIYSVTQGQPGGLPTEFKIREPGKFALESPFHTVNEPKSVKSEYFDAPLEKHFDKGTWFARLSYEGNSIPADSTLDIDVDGQICSDGENGMCMRLEDVSVTAKLDPGFDMEPLLNASKIVPKNLGGFDPAAKAGEEETSGTKTAFNLENLETDELVKVNSLWQAILFGFLGGLILNIMPCVLPVIGLKILSFFEQAGKNRVRALTLNIWYSLGLLSVFLVLAVIARGLNFMFSYSLFNIVMISIVFAMALSLMGLWELRTPSFLGGSKSAELMEKEGVFGAFFKGIITTLLAIPCGAPLLAPSIAWADMQIREGMPHNVYIVFACIGLGMASPYLLIGAFPELLRFLPKPGMWMETFKHVMGYVLLVAVAWILFYIQFELVMPTVTLLFAIWFACWLIGRLPYGTPFSTRAWSWALSIGLIFVMIIVAYDFPGNPNPVSLQKVMQARLDRGKTEYLADYLARTEQVNETVTDEDEIDHDKYWIPYSNKKLETAISEGKIVMVDFTADWCVTCKGYEATVLHSNRLLDVVDKREIVTLQADVTRDDDSEASVLLKALGGGRAVPIVAIFHPGEPTKPKMLRGGSLTPKPILDALDSIEQ